MKGNGKVSYPPWNNSPKWIVLGFHNEMKSTVMSTNTCGMCINDWDGFRPTSTICGGQLMSGPGALDLPAIED